MNFDFDVGDVFNLLVDLFCNACGLLSDNDKSDYPERSADSEKIQEQPVTERPADPKQKLVSSRLGAKLDKEFWETF